MKKEIFRMHNGFIRQGRIQKGPFFLHFCKGEISGIITDDSFEKEMLIQFFRCKNSLVSGDFYYNEQGIVSDDRNSIIRRLISETTSVISGNSQLFESLTIVDNIFIPSFFIKRRKHKKVAARLMEFFDIDIPLHMKIKDLTTFQRLQIEILHAVVCHHKLIIVSDINGMLRSKERNKLRQLYERLAQIGYAICQIESLNNISLNTLDRVQVIEKGRGVGSYSRVEIEYSEIARLINADGESNPGELLRKKDDRFFDGFKGIVLEAQDICCGHLQQFSLKLSKGEIAEINCRSGMDYLEIKSVFTGRANPTAGKFIYEGRPRNLNVLSRAITRGEIGCVDFANLDNLLFENLSITENACYPLCLKNPGFFLHHKYRKLAEDYIRKLMPGLDLEKSIKSLTQEQIMQLAFCKWILCKPKLLLLFIPSPFLKDEPDHVIDRLMIELSRYGVPVLILSERYKFESKIIETEYVIHKGVIAKKQ
ncbi:sugar ABC transporter ATP-binding protein [Diplocloster modestus]|uniref:ABC transporter domain-containing protein n=1 Tax=Diplocloster modestus TaxID=2850322 RepID=A0ABS6KAJ7_9FIRM|nr:hypothetical protein [Diplocloster modestus]MBU9727548.1 hypothetical protein [Diplocloster modestus]